MATVITTTFKLRRGQSSLWESKNPVLAEGEPGYALDTGVLKIGDGLSRWTELNAISGEAISISPDEKSLAYDSNGNLTVFGFEDAEINQIPCKNESGELIWMTLAKVAYTGLIEDLQQKEEITLYGGKAPGAEEEM